MPFALSVTGLRLPAEVARVTVPALAERVLSLASFAVTVIVEVELPFAVIDAGEALITVWAALSEPVE